MTKLFRLIGFVLLFLILLLIILGISSSSEITITQTHHLQVPLSLVWKYMTDPDKCSEWITQFQVQLCNGDTNGVITCYEDEFKLNKLFTISKIEEHKSIQLKLAKSRSNPYIKNYLMKVHLKHLRDGSTEINCELKYQLTSYIAKFINKLYFEGYQKSLLDQNMISLHKYFEKV